MTWYKTTPSSSTNKLGVECTWKRSANRISFLILRLKKLTRPWYSGASAFKVPFSSTDRWHSGAQNNTTTGRLSPGEFHSNVLAVCPGISLEETFMLSVLATHALTRAVCSHSFSLRVSGDSRAAATFATLAASTASKEADALSGQQTVGAVHVRHTLLFVPGNSHEKPPIVDSRSPHSPRAQIEFHPGKT